MEVAELFEIQTQHLSLSARIAFAGKNQNDPLPLIGYPDREADILARAT